MNKEQATIKFKQFIEGKRVIFVGPAPVMVKRGLGDWIDSFDVVIRSNGSIFLLDKPKFRKDYGSKCDVLYVNRQFSREIKKFDVADWKKKWGLKFISGKSYKERHNILYGEQIGIVGAETAFTKTKSIQGALMGPIVLTHLLEQNPLELWFTGMSFYIEKPDVFIPGDYREYYPGYLPEVITEKADIKNIGRLDGHDQYSNTRYIKALMDNHGVKTNDFIEDLMKDVLSKPNYYCVEGRRKRMNKQGVEVRLV